MKTGTVTTPQHTVLDATAKVKLQKAAQDFEGLFVSYLLKTMRQSVPESDLFGKGFGGDLMQDLFDMELSQHIAHHGSFGIAEMLYRQLTGENLPRVFTLQANPLPPATNKAQEAPESVSSNVGKTLSERLVKYSDIIAEASQQYNVDENLIKAVIAGESGAKPDAISSKGAKGLMQLIDETAKELGVRNSWDPRENIFGGTKLLRQLLDRFDGDVQLALAAYNAGASAVEIYGGVPPYKETQTYIKRVLNYVKLFELSTGNEIPV